MAAFNRSLPNISPFLYLSRLGGGGVVFVIPVLGHSERQPLESAQFFAAFDRVYPFDGLKGLVLVQRNLIMSYKGDSKKN